MRARDRTGDNPLTRTSGNLRIDGNRLWAAIHDMAKIGPGIAGGSNRQTLTDADGEGRELFRKWCEDAGCTVGIDQLGNMFAERAGSRPDLLPVYVGSHLDTQPTGGRYDGVLGVLGALELVRTLDDFGIETERPIVITNWTNEEGTRFAPAMLASGVFAGMHDLEWALDRTDAEGKRFGDELQRIGWQGEEKVGSRKMAAFFELHIEQGPILEAEDTDIGVVTHGQGLSWTQVTITGKEAHTGSTPMPMRHNAGLGMAKVLQLVDEIAWSHKPDAVGAAGHIDVHPNSRNVIPGKVVFTVDFRSPKKDVIADMVTRLESGAREICDKMGLKVEFEQVGGFDPVEFDAGCVEAVREAAIRLGYSHRNLVSGAGHDACWINRVVPTAMIMCPCVDGLSHNEAEDISQEWATAGVNVLLHAVLETAGVKSE